MERRVEETQVMGPGFAQAIVGRFSWGAVWAGMFTSVGVWFLLHLLGLGIGLVAIDPNRPGSLRSIGIGAGVWSLIIPLIALFIGGIVAGRGAGPATRGHGAIHGVVLWAVTTVLSVLAVFWIVGSVVGGVARAGGVVVSTTAQAVGNAPGDLAALGVDANTLIAPVNRRLQAEGKPAVTADQLNAAAKVALNDAAATGRFDRETMVNALAQTTELSPADAEQLAVQVQQRFDQKIAQLQRGGEQAQGAALAAARPAGKALLWTFFSLLLAMISAVLGATLGVSREQRQLRLATATIVRESTRPPQPTA